MEKIPFVWERINGGTGSRTLRAKVYGGWIIRNNDFDEDYGQCESMVFIEDHKHLWEIE